MRPATTQISLGIRQVWSESSLSAWRKLGSLATYWAHSENSDQTWWMPRLIWVFVCAQSFSWFCHEAAHFMFNKTIELCMFSVFSKISPRPIISSLLFYFFCLDFYEGIWAPSSEFVSSSIPSWQTLTAHAQPFRGARALAFCLKVPLDSLLVWASSEGSGETARMRRLAWTFAARIGDKYQIRLSRPIFFLWRLQHHRGNFK